ncbi:MAG: TspO/MBR family protein [Candidatus Bathyarchaeia archaeon]
MSGYLFKSRKSVAKLLFSIFICQVVGMIGSIFTSSSISTWYPKLVKPSFTPPNWVFAPVWTSLYFLMGLSLFLLLVKWKEDSKVKTPLSFFATQLFLNGLWSYLFFGLRNTLYGLIGIILLWVMILLTIITAFNISRLAAILLIPYIAWVTIATLLNFYIWKLNIGIVVFLQST